MLQLDTIRDKGNNVFKPWQNSVLDTLEATGKTPMSTRDIWHAVNMIDGITISRASVINFCQDLEEILLLDGVPAKGKGGKRSDYRFIIDRSHFNQLVVMRLLRSLISAFPEVNIKNMIGDL